MLILIIQIGFANHMIVAQAPAYIVSVLRPAAQGKAREEAEEALALFLISVLATVSADLAFDVLQANYADVAVVAVDQRPRLWELTLGILFLFIQQQRNVATKRADSLNTLRAVSAMVELIGDHF